MFIKTYVYWNIKKELNIKVTEFDKIQNKWNLTLKLNKFNKSEEERKIII